jgi:hypothetical protein
MTVKGRIKTKKRSSDMSTNHIRSARENPSWKSKIDTEDLGE